ncbi:hypothetical protein FVEN_g31 [Fusarium venenatum]|uniref:ATP-grasp domain-containing protein n=1 Tax=Fusarium venenatum TaxID=56646 RepID=A0A2L2TDE7_9HYPO|nr:uncharacterized protein FVRRES_07887 [Fusarium venenatum]KAG8362194.1 hypothetical protein FVEN_g31 [Fusarium venenatum]KAH6994771.1 solid-state culture-specific protein-like protein [Fusarium venenatum]CEI63451.1 unnamed protein product [Fusarium venenatum]
MSSIIEFDSTLKDLYALSPGDDAEIHLCHTIPTVQVQMTKKIPICKKYAYQDPLSHKDRGVQARIFSQVVPQLFGIIAGKMNLIMFDLDGQGRDDVDLKPRADTQKVMQQICEHQRPTVTYVRSPSDVVISEGAKLGLANPMDCLEHLPAAVPLEAHYRALSKRELVFSGLPTPPSMVIDTQLNPEQVLDSEIRAKEVTQMLSCIEEKSLPFVVKLPQALSGQGTFLIRNESDRSASLAVLRQEVDHMLVQLNDSNSHLHPTSIVVQEIVPGSALAISLFLPKNGEPILTSCCDQFVSEDGHWDGGHIDYSKQSHLKAEYLPIAKKIAAYMSRLGYYGPLGADIMTDVEGNHLVIDLNARVTGSHPLGFLKGFFSVTRGFNDAAVFFPLFINLSLDQFREIFSAELDEGRIVIAGWCHEQGLQSSVTTIIVAAEDQERLGALAQRIKAFATLGH